MHVSDKVNQESQGDILLGDTAWGQSRSAHASADLRLVGVHQDLGGIANRGDNVNLVVCPSVFAKHAVVTGDVVDGCNVVNSTRVQDWDTAGERTSKRTRLHINKAANGVPRGSSSRKRVRR
jgi:hypothetical protein